MVLDASSLTVEWSQRQAGGWPRVPLWCRVDGLGVV